MLGILSKELQSAHFFHLSHTHLSMHLVFPPNSKMCSSSQSGAVQKAWALFKNKQKKGAVAGRCPALLQAGRRAHICRQGAGAEWLTWEQALQNGSHLEQKHPDRIGGGRGGHYGLENMP